MDRIRREDALNLPNLLTVLRVALLPVIVWCFRRGSMRSALFVYLAAMLSDVADGCIARHTGKITEVGKLLDPVADKLCLLTLLVLFASEGQIPVWLVSVVVMKEALLILGGVAALKQGIVVSALPVGKLTTLSFVLSTCVRFLGWIRAADVLLWGSVMLSLAALIWYGAAFVKQIQELTV